MRKSHLPPLGLIWAFAALLAVATPGTPLVQAAARLSNAALLAAQLPSGEKLATAPMKDVEAAVRAAVAKRPAAAGAILKIALMAKAPKRGPMVCGDVKAFVAYATAGAPDQARVIAEMAQSLAPDCADAISAGTRTPVLGTVAGIATTGAAVPGSTTGQTGSTDGSGNPTGTSAAGEGDASGAPAAGDFGAGFGPGFPGSPGFAGSSPSGGFALPPTTGNDVTRVVND